MNFEHDNEGVSIDLTPDEAEEFAAYMFTRSTRSGGLMAELKGKLHGVFAGQARYESRIRGHAAMQREQKAKVTRVHGKEVVTCTSGTLLIHACVPNSWLALVTCPPCELEVAHA
jgi:hypothetical protein